MSAISASRSSETDVDIVLFTTVRTLLYTPVIGDVLDAMGFVHQFLSPEIRGITSDTIVVGRAMPVLISEVFGQQSAPFGRLTEALDQLQPGDVYLGRDAGTPTAAWGEILTATAIHRGAVGAVLDGYHRDSKAVLAQEWPVFSRGGYAQDAAVRKAVVDYRVPIEVGGVRVEPGDLVVGDRDGVLIVPSSVEAEVIERSLVKATTENHVRKAIEAGMSSTEAFRTFGVL